MFGGMGETFTTRGFDADDAGVAGELLAAAFTGREREFPGVEQALEVGPLMLAQTGSRLLVAEDDKGRLAGLARWWDEEGIAWLDLLAARRAGAGPALMRAVERGAQDHGLRLLRARVPQGSRLEDFFRWRGYIPVAHERDGPGHEAQTVLEKRLPLLTVREQRRGDASAIGELTGEDPWVFEQGTRPGWFVLADGERVVGAIAVRETSRGAGAVRAPMLRGEYEGRGLEVWMLERAALYAGTNGMLSLTVPASAPLDRLRRELEDNRWFREGAGTDAVYRKQLGGANLLEP